MIRSAGSLFSTSVPARSQISVRTAPGSTVWMLTPFSVSSLVKAWDKASTKALEAL